MRELDTFFLMDLGEVKQDVETEMTVRDIKPGKAKYRCQVVHALFSSDPDKYPDRLWPRLGRGQWVGRPWSIKILKEISMIPKEWQ